MAKNSTSVTVAPALPAAVAVTVVAVPTGTEAFALGAVIETLGSAVTVTVMGVDVKLLLLVSSTRAVIELLPAAVGVHTTEYGNVVSVPRMVVPERNCTWATLAPDPAVAIALSVTGVPRLTIVPVAGAVIVAVGSEFPTTTLTALEVAVMPTESVTCAVSATLPAAEGVHTTE